jgi:HEAT repeat protein
MSRLGGATTPERVRKMAALMMKDRRDPSILPTLRRIVLQDTEVKAALTLALSNFEDEETVRLIIHRLVDPHRQVRAAAAIGLSRLTVPEMKELAIRALTAALSGEAGPVDREVGINMEIARDILRRGKAKEPFRWLGNGGHAEGRGGACPRFRQPGSRAGPRNHESEARQGRAPTRDRPGRERRDFRTP